MNVTKQKWCLETYSPKLVNTFIEYLFLIDPIGSYAAYTHDYDGPRR